MKFIISGKNIEVTEGIKAAIEEKLGRPDKYFSRRYDRECNFKCSEGKTEDRSYHSYERGTLSVLKKAVKTCMYLLTW